MEISQVNTRNMGFLEVDGSSRFRIRQRVEQLLMKLVHIELHDRHKRVFMLQITVFSSKQLSPAPAWLSYSNFPKDYQKIYACKACAQWAA
jgi:hypothetical protein